MDSSYEKNKIGLTTMEGLASLYDDIYNEVSAYEAQQNHTSYTMYVNVLSTKNVFSCFHVTSLVQVLVVAVCLLAAYSASNQEAQHWWLIESFILVAFAVFNTLLVGRLHTERRDEYIRLTRHLLSVIDECVNHVQWSSNNYPHIYSPLSPCVSLQWTFRDGEVVNLPQCLLTQGDVILIRPGHRAPAKCHLIQDDCDNSHLDHMKSLTLDRGDIYDPNPSPMTTPHTARRKAHSREPLTPVQFMLDETPYIRTLRKTLGTNSEPPPSVLDNERIIVVRVMLHIFLGFMVLILLCSVIRFTYFGAFVGHWTHMVLVIPVHTVLPLVSLVFPIFWTLVMYLNQARLLTAFDVIKKKKGMHSIDSSFDYDKLAQNSDIQDIGDKYKVWTYVKKIARGELPVVLRRVDLFHTLGSITSFCCVDKKGVLSWPNPTAEKVFFPTRSSGIAELNKNNSHIIDTCKSNESNFEVLDLTHDAKSSFGLQFDNPEWQNYLPSLKPIGLNILLNTCNMGSVEWYTQFTDHVTCVANKHDETVAVVNRRCLCELARQIGFKQKAADVFKLSRIIGLYKQISAEETAKERVHRAHSAVEHKIPMPNMVSAILQHNYSDNEVMSQGTGDIIMDCCTDYWDGYGIHLMTRADRKKILDFYRRTSMTAYCTSFSYSPLLTELSATADTVYTELPNYKTPQIPILSDEQQLTDKRRSLSFDTIPNTNTPKIRLCETSKALSNQIFIGMVTMQYQARQDIVQLIDQLDNACIRFVHFSEENEVRSRVFSEKMGLEAGWNCHISLKPNQNYNTGITESELGHKNMSFHIESESGEITEILETLKKPIDDMKSKSSPNLCSIVSTPTSSILKVKTEVDSKCVIREKLGSDVGDEFTKLLSTDDCWIDATINSSDEGDVLIDHMSSYITLHSDSHSDALDNRANLPRGIENIRPHLRDVDNVPLLVNLFTDCTPDTTAEMIHVLQEHGEVVLCLGSSLNFSNTSLFLQANIGVAVEPLHPQICAKYDVVVAPWNETMMTPCQLAGVLTALPCSMVIKQSENVNFVQLIALARSLVMSVRSCFLLMLHIHLSLSLIQLISSLFQFSPVLSGRHLLWQLLVVSPALSASVLRVKFDPRTLVWATSKNLHLISRDVVVSMFCLYSILIVYRGSCVVLGPTHHTHTPTVLGPAFENCEVVTQLSVFCLYRILMCTVVTVCSFGLTSHATCVHVSTNTTNCNLYSGLSGNASWNPWLKNNEASLTLAQNIVTFQLTLNFAVTSMSFLHRYDQIWVQVPFKNLTWLGIVSSVLALQVLYCIIDVTITPTSLPLTSLPISVVILTCIWPVCIVVVNELIKRKEIKQWVRYQKRCRLNFGTKLGMNSPF